MAHHHGLSIAQIPQNLPVMKTIQSPPYDPLKVKLTPHEQSIEDQIDENAPIQHASPEVLEQVRLAGQLALDRLRGGKRPGSGRKAREYVRTTVLLAPEVREKLERLAEQYGSLSRAVEAAVLATP